MLEPTTKTADVILSPPNWPGVSPCALIFLRSTCIINHKSCTARGDGSAHAFPLFVSEHHRAEFGRCLVLGRVRSGRLICTRPVVRCHMRRGCCLSQG